MIIRLVCEDGSETVIDGMATIQNSQLQIHPNPIDDLNPPPIVLSNPKLINISKDRLLELEAVEPLGSGVGKAPRLYKVFVS